VQAVVTGHVGPKAWSALQASGIRVYTTAGGSVAQAAEAFRAGRLPELTQADGSAQR
jgi:predicted Fe-Mo cluster-binding NifX family protein